MSRKASPTLIGVFVVGAIAIIVAIVLVLGGGTFMKERVPFVMHFDGSIKGLNVGAPVMFRGVKVGAVTDIKIEFDPRDMSLLTPVFVEFQPERVTHLTGESDPKRNIEQLIDRGLMAQLEMQSLVTGMLMIAVDFHPDVTPVRVGIDKGVPEVPTIPTTFQALTRTIENLELDELLAQIYRSVDAFETFISSPELLESIRTLNTTLEDVQIMARNINGQVEPLSETINEVSMATCDVLAQAVKSLSRADELIAEDGSPRYELIKTLEEVSAAARSIRVFAEYLERHPEAILHGKPGSKGKIK